MMRVVNRSMDKDKETGITMVAKRYSSVRFGHFRWPYVHANQSVPLAVRSFPLLFYSHHRTKMFLSRAMGQTDRHTEESQHCLMQHQQGGD